MNKPTMSNDGKLRVNIRLSVRHDLRTLTAILAASWRFDPDEAMTLAQVRNAIVSELHDQGTEPMIGDYESLDDYEARYAAALPLVARAYGFPLPTGKDAQ